MWSNIAERDGTARGLLMYAFAETGLSAVMLDRFCGEFVRAARHFRAGLILLCPSIPS
jgi:hypothetical protein